MPRSDYNNPGPPATYSPQSSDLSEEDAAWLRGLQPRLWETGQPDRFGTLWTTEKRGEKLKPEELDRLFRLIRTHKLLTRMGSGMFGLPGYSMSVWTHSSFPGVPPEFLCCVSEDHFEEPKARDAILDHAWQVFSGFTHSPENREMLEFYKLEPPRERTHYDY